MCCCVGRVQAAAGARPAALSLWVALVRLDRSRSSVRPPPAGCESAKRAQHDSSD
jgi:hypothetical protein